jgi:cytochrome c oxidase subunit 3
MATTLSGPADAPRKRIHPHKFALWIAMGSIAMMFAGLTSAYIVRQAQGDWRVFTMPDLFWVSTVLILISSVTMFAAVRAFKARRIPRYRMLVGITLALGIAFGVCQYLGFYELYHTAQPYFMTAPTDGSSTATFSQNGTEMRPVKVNGNPAESFLFIIAGLHLLHILGGIIALIIVFWRSYRTRVKVYSSTGLEVVGQYWHFVDVLWIYLFVFLLVNH